jgi:hypothetical protein
MQMPPSPNTETPVAEAAPTEAHPVTAKQHPVVLENANERASTATTQLRGPGGSVSDRLRKLSGRSYDVYRDRFLAKARAAVRAVLSKTRPRSLFASIPEEAEELVFGFLRDHYSDPYMDWEGGEQKKRLRELGFELESLDPVIEDCYHRL